MGVFNPSSASESAIDGEVANYAALPSAASASGETYRVLAEQGTWLLGTLKRAGDYYSNGSTWTHLGTSTQIVKVYDSSTTDNALVKYHGTDGQSIQETGIIVDDSDNVSGLSSLNINSSTTVSSILDQDDMSSDSATALATQQSIKAYVDANAGGGGGLVSGAKLDGSSLYSGSPMAATNFTTGSAFVSYAYYQPLFVATETTFTRIGARIATATGTPGDYTRLAIYFSISSGSGDLAPGALVVDAGTIDSNSATEQEITINETLSPGLYWLAASPNATVSMTRFNGGTANFWMALTGTVSSNSETFFQCLQKSSSGEETGFSDPALTSLSRTTSAPRIWLRVV